MLNKSVCARLNEYKNLAEAQSFDSEVQKKLRNEHFETMNEYIRCPRSAYGWCCPNSSHNMYCNKNRKNVKSCWLAFMRIHVERTWELSGRFS